MSPKIGSSERGKMQIIAAHQSLTDLDRKVGQIVESTIVALLVCDRHGLAIWAGDSRAYLYRQGTLHRVNRDCSDGLYEELNEEAIQNVVDSCVERGARNNATVVAVKVVEHV